MIVADLQVIHAALIDEVVTHEKCVKMRTTRLAARALRGVFWTFIIVSHNPHFLANGVSRTLYFARQWT